jgi:hypothetical protein
VQLLWWNRMSSCLDLLGSTTLLILCTINDSPGSPNGAPWLRSRSSMTSFGCCKVRLSNITAFGLPGPDPLPRDSPSSTTSSLRLASWFLLFSIPQSPNLSNTNFPIPWYSGFHQFCWFKCFLDFTCPFCLRHPNLPIIWLAERYIKWVRRLVPVLQ